MKIKQINKQQLVVALSYTDLLEMGFTYHSLNYKCEKAKSAINKLFKRAALASNFNSSPDKLLIEAYPAPDMGCVLYFTDLRAKAKWRKSDTVYPFTFEFINTDDMFLAAKQLHLQKISGASLYKFGGNYRLILSCSDKSPLHIMLRDYSRPLGRDSAISAHTREHGRLISSDAARDLH